MKILQKCIRKQNNNNNKQVISPSILTLTTPAVELPAQLIATTKYSYTVLILSCVLSIVSVFGALYMSVLSRYTKYEATDLSLDGVNQLISVLEQLLSVWERVTTGEEGGAR